MATRNRALTGTSSPTTQADIPAGLTFPARLIHPQQTQLARSEDSVGNRVVQLDVWAQRLGEGFGIPFSSFSLNSAPVGPTSQTQNAVNALLLAMTHREERISLERRGGKWGLYFTREPALLSQDRKVDAVALKDAPLDVRERFLTVSEEFFRAYLKLCEDRLGRMSNAVTKADQTLSLLSQIKFS